MCGRFTLRRDYDGIRHDLCAESGGGSIIFEPRYNIAPAGQVPILRLGGHGQRQLAPMVWGIAMPARDNQKRLTRHINARAENLMSSALWRPASSNALPSRDRRVLRMGRRGRGKGSTAILYPPA
jgi:putative SOS response-associated peptidase YedK